MTREEAISRIQDHMQIHKIGEYPHLKLGEALDMAIGALRAQRESNNPLTLDELREMDGAWVWIANPNKKIPAISGYHQLVYHTEEGFRTRSIWLSVKGFGTLWLAYCRKPEEVGT